MDEGEKTDYKYCIVPCCTNSTVKTPNKLFFYVPRDAVKRKAWTTAMKRDDKKNKKLSNKTSLYCCEDHFSLEHDMTNYWQWQLTKDVKRFQLNAGVVPHRFDCQKVCKPTIERKGAQKRKRMSLVQDALSAGPVASTSADVLIESSDEAEIQVELQRQDKCVQVNMRKAFRSKHTNTNLEVRSVGCSPVKLNKSISTHISPQKFSEENETADISDISSESDSEFECSESESKFELNYSSEDDDFVNQQYQKHMLEGTIMAIERNPKLFLGLPPKSFFLIQQLTDHSKLPTVNIYIVLKKIRLHVAFSILAIDFGMSISNVSRIFSKSLHVLASLMQELIVWPSAEEIRARLPIPFRAQYGSVNTIIDCFEIEKPSNPVEQSLTWSSYYSCNTIKYMVSCTPDGLVTFVSEGYGGRTSDLAIVEDCEFASKLTPGTSVMADRGFKHIYSIFEPIGCKLVRPPTVSALHRSTKAKVKQSQRIAALRIHVERVIGRFREFKMLGPHACINYSHIKILDKAIIVASGIINMQDLLFKR